LLYDKTNRKCGLGLYSTERRKSFNVETSKSKLDSINSEEHLYSKINSFDNFHVLCIFDRCFSNTIVRVDSHFPGKLQSSAGLIVDLVTCRIESLPIRQY